MAFWTIWTADLARGRFTQVGTSTAPSSAIFAIDGNNESLYEMGATSGSFELILSVALGVRAFAIGNHNLIGATVAHQTWNGASYDTEVTLASLPRDDFLYEYANSTGQSSLRHKLNFSGAGANITIGTISLLMDCGDTAAGADEYDTGRSRLAFSQGGPYFPLSRPRFDPNVYIPAGGGDPVVQSIRSAGQQFGLNLAHMLTGDQAGSDDRLFKTWDGIAQYVPNPGWRDGVWLTDDTHDQTSTPKVLTAWYCRPVAGSGIPSSRPRAGQTDAQIVLEEKSRGVA